MEESLSKGYAFLMDLFKKNSYIYQIDKEDEGKTLFRLRLANTFEIRIVPEGMIHNLSFPIHNDESGSYFLFKECNFREKFKLPKYVRLRFFEKSKTNTY